MSNIFDEQIEKQSEKQIDMGVMEIVKRHEREEGIHEGIQLGKAQIIGNLIRESKISDP